MGLFGKIFDKKECSVCGGEIGLLGNRKLEDGNLCKNCAKKLSPWFEERRHSTVEEIKEQLAYREENKQKAAQFKISRSIGEDWKLLVDDSHRWVTVTDARNLAEANPDILDFGSITGCRVDIDESHREITQRDAEGNERSYQPPRYEYSYYFDIIVSVSNPYFDEMKFRLNSGTIRVMQGMGSNMGIGMGGGFGGFFGSSPSGFDPTISPEYRQYQQMAQEICDEVRRIQEAARGGQGFAPRQAAPAGPWSCPACGGQNSGRFCEFCGAARPQ